ncbi:hypothetical protein GUITHDRAFT_57273, partial [Guillardia theta CCMP2712]
LIGDHHQLRPKVNLYELTWQSRKGFDIDRSLFERLVEDRNAPTSVLRRQYRMRPEISRLIRETIYPDLLDGQRVLLYPPVKGMLYPVFFWHHSVPEDSFHPGDMRYQTQEGSKTNSHEVACVIALVTYLLQQGYARDQITILTGYLGQSVLITKELKKLSASKSGIRVATVDNYQGEENDLLILSLVRSNPTQMSGFMKVENRVNVLLSRAKQGMYIIGDKDTLTHRDAMWSKVVSILSESSCVGDAIPITCQRHPKDIRCCRDVKDFKSFALDGGCILPCPTRLSCGHACPRLCHPDGHEGFQCRQPCTRRPDQCQQQHRCKKLCFQACGKCSELIETVLPCGHTKPIECWRSAEPSRSYCAEKVTVLMPKLSNLCGHVCNAPCHQSNGTKCGMSFCQEPCVLGCQHSSCSKPCGYLCQPCIELCDWHCEHAGRCSLLCLAPCDRLPCNERCSKTLSCGHRCPSVCGEP